MKTKKMISMFLVSALLLGLMPTVALAEDTEQPASNEVIVSVQTKEGSEDYTYCYLDEETEGYTQIEDTGVFYKAEGENVLDSDTTLVARRNVVWDELYQDMAGVEDAGFDVVTTATTASAVDGNTWNAYSELSEDGSQTLIYGSKVPTKISAKTYVEALILKAAGKATEDSLDGQIAELTQASTEDSGTTWAKSKLYYTVTESGFSLILPETIKTTPKNAQISDSTNWGDYLVTVTDEEGKHYVKTGKMDTVEYDPTNTDESVLAGYQLGNKTMYAATFTTSDGKVYTMGYLENMWSASYEFSFRISENTPMTGMPDSTNYEQYADLPGKTITGMTYYGAYGVYQYDLSDFHLKVTHKQNAEIKGDYIVSVVSGENAVVNVDLSELINSADYDLVSVSAGSGREAKVLDSTDFSFDAEAGKVTINASALETNAYILSFVDRTGEYATVTYSVAISVTEKAPQSIANATVSGVKDVYATGSAIVPDTEVKIGNATLVKGSDYTVSVKNNIVPGTATVTIEGKGNYTGIVTKTFKIYAKNQATYSVGNYKYKVTNPNYSGKGTVTVTGNIKNSASINVGNTVKIGTATYKITAIAANAFKNNTKATKVVIGANVSSIGKNAFYNCKKVKSVTIKSKGLTSKSVKSKAFSKLGASNYKKVTVKVPASKLKTYKKILVSKGLSKKTKIKK